MAQHLIQTQTQQQVQQQKLSQQQMLEVRLLEMPLAELEQNIAAEMDDNPALERVGNDESSFDSNDMEGSRNEDDYAENAESGDAIDSVLADLESDDNVPTADSRRTQMDTNAAEEEEMVWGDTISFYDRLKQQMGEMDLTEEEHAIMEYLIGSLDTDGLLRKPLDAVCDELAIYQNIDVPVGKIEDVLEKLQTFDPAGIGARTLQECLILQIKRKPSGRMRELMLKVMEKQFDNFTKLHWDRIAAALKISEDEATELRSEITRLNPKPGASLGETEGKNLQQVTPDFIIESDDEGHISFTLNQGHIPMLNVSQDFAEMVDTYRNNKSGMNRKEKEALLYAKQKVDRAKGYIEAIRQRQHTLRITMQAIIEWQKDFFRDGDEADLKPMVLRDIAEKTGLDISTVSRVGNVKYAQTPWGTFPLRFFFSGGYDTGHGEETSTRHIKLALKELVDAEDKKHPLSDDVLSAQLKAKGFPIARRTVSKYREQLGIPMARLRKQ